MNQSGINPPTPITPKARRAIQGVCIDSRLCAYGSNDWETEAWYKETSPGFTKKKCASFDLYSNAMIAKQHRNVLKKQSKKDKGNSKFSR